METTKKWSKMLLAGMLVMVLTFGLVLAGCYFGEEEEPTSISISGTPKVGETLTATSNVGSSWADTATWFAYDDAACTITAELEYSIWIGDHVPVLAAGTANYLLPAKVEGKWIRASVTGARGGEGNDPIYSNILGPVAAAEPTVPSAQSVTISPPTASVAKAATKQFTVTINAANYNSSNVVWTVEGSSPSGTSTITGSGNGVGSGTNNFTQTRTLTVGAGETASTLMVRVTYGDKSAAATVTVQ
jgi:hypothetical protein